MKGQLWHCKRVEWKTKNAHTRVRDALLVFLCFEIGDSLTTVKEVSRRILQLNKKRFAHLSSHVMPTKEAGGLLKELRKMLSDGIVTLESMPFNKKKEIIIQLYEYNSDVSFFEYS